MTNPPDRNAPCPCGSTKKYKHCCLRQAQAAAHKPQLGGVQISMWMQLAMQHLQQGRLAQAKALYDQVLQNQPQQAEALQWLGVICHHQGNNTQAIALIEQAIALQPKQAFFRSTLGNVLQAAGQLDKAVACYQQALDINPSLPEAHNNMGNAWLAMGKLADARQCYQKAMALAPNYAEAHNNMGTVNQESGLSEQAEAYYRKAIAIKPDYAQALANLAGVMMVSKPDEAVGYARKALTLQPVLYDAWITMGKLVQNQGHMADAAVCYQRAYALKPNAGLKVLEALMLAPILGNKEEVSASRARFEQNLEQLIASGVKLHDPVKELCGTNFHLAYHAVNDRATQQRVAEFYTQACPSLLYEAPHCTRARTEKHVVRVGFMSKFIAKHSVALSYSRIVEMLAKDARFEVALISSHDPQTMSVQETYPGFGGQYVRLLPQLDQARAQIAALELDILVYLDIGMDPMSYFLAYARLAPVQCMCDGHPVTSGIPTMDYFLSADWAEPEDAQDHYSEKLMRFPFGAYYFEKAQTPVRFKSRQELGLPAYAHLYACPMTLFKLHPDFDEAMTRILELDPQGCIVLFADKKYTNWRLQLEARVTKTVPLAVRDRIVFQPWVVDPMDFMCTIEQSDVVLDPFHFGLGTTAIAAFTVGTPFVTKPGAFVRGRYGYYYSRLMQVMDGVAEDTEDYARKAVAIATDPNLRNDIKQRILANNSALFGNDQGIHEVRDFFLTVQG
jgi:protein O-GlcNAc transferase